MDEEQGPMGTDDDRPPENDSDAPPPPGGEDEGGEVVRFPGLVEGAGDQFDQDAYSTEELAALSGDPVPLPGDVDDEATPPLSLAEDELSDEADDVDDLADDSGDIEDFTEEHYVQSTTREYQGLAESIAEAADRDHAPSAVAAAMPGLEQGVIGFEDMTGETEPDAEELQQIEKAQRSDLIVRVGTGVTLVALFFGALYAGAEWITVFLALLVLVALNELYQAVRSVGYSPVGLFGLLGVIGVFIAAWSSGPFASGGVLAGVVLVSSLWYAVLPRRYPLANAAITVFGVAWIGLLASFAIPIFQTGDSEPLVIALVVLTAFNDIGAYFTGRAMGSRQLAPVLSPKKTVEGFVGGAVISVLLGAGMGQLGFFDPLTVASGVALGVVISLVGPLGDLAESAVKRLIGVKDMGSILPGHGGVLDRIDAFLFTIPAGYLLFRWFEYL